MHKGNQPKNRKMFLNLGMDFMSCILIGLFVGLGLDRVFDTKPLFLIIFLVFGIAAGFLKVYRMTKEYYQ